MEFRHVSQEDKSEKECDEMTLDCVKERNDSQDNDAIKRCNGCNANEHTSFKNTCKGVEDSLFSISTCVYY